MEISLRPCVVFQMQEKPWPTEEYVFGDPKDLAIHVFPPVDHSNDYMPDEPMETFDLDPQFDVEPYRVVFYDDNGITFEYE
jgi:hypothetical protein